MEYKYSDFVSSLKHSPFDADFLTFLVNALCSKSKTYGEVERLVAATHIVHTLTGWSLYTSKEYILSTVDKGE